MTHLHRSAVSWLLSATLCLGACYQDRTPRPRGDWQSHAAGRSEFGSFEVWAAGSTDDQYVCLNIEMTPDAFVDDGLEDSDRGDRYQGRDYSCVPSPERIPILLFATTGGSYGAVALLLPPETSATVGLADGTVVRSVTNTAGGGDPNLFLGFYPDSQVRLTGVMVISGGSEVECDVPDREPLGPVGELDCQGS